MNSTKMHAIASAIDEEFKRADTPKLLQAIISNLENQINQPNQAKQFQLQVSTSLNKLYEALADSPIDAFSPAWRDALSELRIAKEFGKKLDQRVRAIFEKNTITPHSAIDELTIIKKEIDGTKNHVSGLVSSLTYFGIGEDVLQSGEAEVGVIIPRMYVQNNLKNFGSELIELEKILLVFTELVTGSREPIKIRQISSSELSVFLDHIPETCACLAIAIERIVELYKSLLEIKTLKQGLVSQDIPEEALKGITDHAKSVVKPEMEKLANELIETYGGEIAAGRNHEIKTELRQSLNKLAERIDRGFQIELRIYEDTTDSEDESNEHSAARIQIIESSAKISLLGSVAEPVLFLTDENKET